MSSFLVTLDNVAYKTKPDAAETARVTIRLENTQPTELDPATFCEALRRGVTWVGACFEPTGRGWGDFLGQQIFGVDLDNSTEYPRRDGTKGKRPLLPDEVGHITPAEALSRCEELGLSPMCMHRTMHDRPENLRFRIIFDMGEPVTDEAEAREIIAALLDAFPEADPSCKNVSRLFFGSNGDVCELWRGEALS